MSEAETPEETEGWDTSSIVAFMQECMAANSGIHECAKLWYLETGEPVMVVTDEADQDDVHGDVDDDEIVLIQPGQSQIFHRIPEGGGVACSIHGDTETLRPKRRGVLADQFRPCRACWPSDKFKSRGNKEVTNQ